MEIRAGTRVYVFNADKSEYWGLGTITKVEPLIIEETKEVVSTDYPSQIKLDNGKITQGLECWWYPVETCQ